jgi:hypothetical protein
MRTSEKAIEVLPNGHHGHNERLLTFSSSVLRLHEGIYSISSPRDITERR